VVGAIEEAKEQGGEEGRSAVSVASVNGPSSVVLSGSEGAVNAVLEQLGSSSVSHRRLVTYPHNHLSEMRSSSLRIDESI